MILVSTVRRTQYALNELKDNFIYVIDWESRKVVKKILVPQAKGAEISSRFSGGRGFSKYGENIFFANYDSLFLLDDNLSLNLFFSSNLFCALHEIYAVEDGIWVTSTHVDSVFFVNNEKQIDKKYFLSELVELTQNPNIDSPVKHRYIDRKKEHRLETYVEPINELSCLPNSVEVVEGNVFVILKVQKKVIQLNPLIIVADISYIDEPHSLTVLADGKVVILSASETKLYVFESIKFDLEYVLDLRNEKIDWPSPLNWNLVGGFAQEGWLRGVCQLPSGNVLVGVAPLTLVEIDIAKRVIVTSKNLETDPCITAFDLISI